MSETTSSTGDAGASTDTKTFGSASGFRGTWYRHSRVRRTWQSTPGDKNSCHLSTWASWLLVLPYNAVARPFRRWWGSSQNNWKWILLRGSNSSWRRWVASGGKLCWKTSTPNLNVQSLGCLKRLTKAMKAMWKGMKSCLKIWLLKEPLWATCGPTCCSETQPWPRRTKSAWWWSHKGISNTTLWWMPFACWEPSSFMRFKDNRETTRARPMMWTMFKKRRGMQLCRWKSLCFRLWERRNSRCGNRPDVAIDQFLAEGGWRCLGGATIRRCLDRCGPRRQWDGHLHGHLLGCPKAPIREGEKSRILALPWEGFWQEGEDQVSHETVQTSGGQDCGVRLPTLRAEGPLEGWMPKEESRWRFFNIDAKDPNGQCACLCGQGAGRWRSWCLRHGVSRPGLMMCLCRTFPRTSWRVSENHHLLGNWCLWRGKPVSHKW